MKPVFFIHISHTAGSSIAFVLSLSRTARRFSLPYYYIPLKGTKVQSRESFLDMKIKDVFTFAFVRNPYDRLVSAYHRGAARVGTSCIYKNFTEWIIDFFKQCKIHLLCCNDPFQQRLWGDVLYTQRSWLIDKQNHIGVDYVGKFENLQEDFDILCQFIGVEKVELPHRNPTPLRHKQYMEYYNKKTRNIVYNYFEEDFKTFGYKK